MARGSGLFLAGGYVKSPLATQIISRYDQSSLIYSSDNMKFSLVRPCKECPFKKDKSYLHPERALEIAELAVCGDKTFICHKTIGGSEQHCAGALLMSEKHGRRNSMHQIAYRLGLYQPESLDAEAEIYETPEQMMQGHAQ